MSPCPYFAFCFLLLSGELEALDLDRMLKGGCSCLDGNERIYPFLRFMRLDGFRCLIGLKMHIRLSSHTRHGQTEVQFHRVQEPFRMRVMENYLEPSCKLLRSIGR